MDSVYREEVEEVVEDDETRTEGGGRGGGGGGGGGGGAGGGEWEMAWGGNEAMDTKPWWIWGEIKLVTAAWWWVVAVVVVEETMWLVASLYLCLNISLLTALSSAWRVWICCCKADISPMHPYTGSLNLKFAS